MPNRRKGLAFATALVVAIVGASPTFVVAAPAKPGPASDYFRVLRSPRGADDHLPPSPRLWLRDIETDFEINVQRSGIRQVYRHRANRVWLIPGTGWLCLMIRHHGGYAGCATVADARRGRLHATFGAGYHDLGWLEEVRVLPDTGHAARMISENGRTVRPKIRHNYVHVYFPAPADLTFRLGDRLVSEHFDDGF
jgi:hypothetical protein